MLLIGFLYIEEFDKVPIADENLGIFLLGLIFFLPLRVLGSDLNSLGT